MAPVSLCACCAVRGSCGHCSADLGLRQPRMGLGLAERPIGFTELHDLRQTPGGQPASWPRLSVLLVPKGPGKWLARSGKFIPSTQTPTRDICSTDAVSVASGVCSEGSPYIWLVGSGRDIDLLRGGVLCPGRSLLRQLRGYAHLNASVCLYLRLPVCSWFPGDAHGDTRQEHRA